MKNIQTTAARLFNRFWVVFVIIKWDTLFLIIFIVVAPILVLHNLELNPRPWHDEGASLSVSKTLALDGVYAVRSSDGFQTFGPVQSVGPTVILPVALVFRHFGVGLVQGRYVAAAYTLITLWIFFYTAHVLFGRKAALLAVGFMLGSPAAGFLLYGRQVLGEAPALGFFLSGWLTWAVSLKGKKAWLSVPSGILLGLAMITKSQYVLLGAAVLGILIILDFFHYRQKAYPRLVVMGIVSVGIFAVWYLWQVNYFGPDVFSENTEKMRQLAGTTVGLNIHSIIDAFRFLLGSGSGHFYFFWGWPALIYAGYLSLQRNRQGLILSFLTVFTILWILYFSFWIIPWFRYFFPAAVMTALFVAKLFSDLADGLVASLRDLRVDSPQSHPDSSLSVLPRFLVHAGVLAGLMTMIFGMGYQLQKVVRDNVLDKYGTDEILNPSPPQFYAPQEVADYLNQSVGRDQVIETWERELDILSDHVYHFPDQSMLAEVHLRLYRGGDNEYGLGEDYFAEVRPDYLVIGWYSRLNTIYDLEAVNKYGEKVATFGSGEWRYDVYKLAIP